MRKAGIVGLMVVLCFITLKSTGQNSLALFHMRNFNDMNSFTPVFIDKTFNISYSFFPFNGASMSVYSTFSLHDASSIQNGVYTSDLGKLYGRINKQNSIVSEVVIPYFNFSIRSETSQWGISAKENIISSFTFDKELVRFLNEGNAGYLGETHQSAINIMTTHYREIALAYIHKGFDSPWTIGARIKFLLGQSHIQSSLSYSLYTDQDLKYLDFTSDAKSRVSFPLDVTNSEKGYVTHVSLPKPFKTFDYLLNMGNPGVGIDIGTVYEVEDKLTLSFSVNDLSTILWSNNIHNISSSGQYKWESFDISNVLTQGGLDSILLKIESTSVIDSVSQFLQITENKNSFLAGIPPKILISGKYSFTKNIDFGFVDRLVFIDGTIRNSLALSANFSVNDAISVSTGALFLPNSIKNLMLAFSIRNKNIEFYLGTENLLALAFPMSSRTFNVGFGMNYRIKHIPNKTVRKILFYPFYKAKRYKSVRIRE